MTTYSVLLEKYRPIPYTEWGTEIASFMGEHFLDVTTKLRRQQGIVWEGLDDRRAELLGSYLINKGFPAGLVEDDEVAKFGTVRLVRNADPVARGIELQDAWENKTLIESANIILAQVGWVEEEIEIGSKPKRVGGGSLDPSGQIPDFVDFSRESIKAPLGWLLHIYHGQEPIGVVRIFGEHFNYDYQSFPDAARNQRFVILLNDLAKVFRYDSLDEGFKLSMGSFTKSPEASYKSLDDMMDRARWAVTLKLVKGM